MEEEENDTTRKRELYRKRIGKDKKKNRERRKG